MATATKKTTTTEAPAEPDTDVFAKAQREFVSIIKNGQTTAMQNYQQWLDLLVDLPTPQTSDVDVPNPMSEEAIDGYFDYSVEMLENQRVFTKKMLGLTSES